MKLLVPQTSIFSAFALHASVSSAFQLCPLRSPPPSLQARANASPLSSLKEDSDASPADAPSLPSPIQPKSAPSAVDLSAAASNEDAEGLPWWWDAFWNLPFTKSSREGTPVELGDTMRIFKGNIEQTYGGMEVRRPKD